MNPAPDYTARKSNEPLKSMVIQLCVALMLCLICPRGKMIPGGPFLSLFSELVPMVLCVSAITTGVWHIRRAGIGEAILIFLLSSLAALMIAVIVRQIILFWVHPYARGALLGL